MSDYEIRMDWQQTRLRDDPHKGHNRWHEDVEPVLEVDQGDSVLVDTRDGFDGQLTRELTPEGFNEVSFLPNHAMTGPIFVRGAMPGDIVEVLVDDIEPDPVDSYGCTVIGPGFGLLSDIFDEVFIAHWDLHDRDYAESEQIPGVRIPGRPFAGLVGTAPNRAYREMVTTREAALAAVGFEVAQPDPRESLPAGRVGTEGLRTIPPRENGGNMDIKQVEAGSSVFLPVYREGALVSIGDGHYAQGDGESCGTAIEMRARMRLRFQIHRGVADTGVLPWPMFLTSDTPRPAPGRSIGVLGLPVKAGVNYSNDLTLSAREALISLVGLLSRAGFSREQAYVLASVAADLHVSQAVDLPNSGVSAILPLDIFLDGGERVLDALRKA